MKALELIREHDDRIYAEYGVRPSLRYISEEVEKELQEIAIVNIPLEWKWAMPSGKYISGIEVVVNYSWKGMIVMTLRKHIKII